MENKEKINKPSNDVEKKIIVEYDNNVTIPPEMENKVIQEQITLDRKYYDGVLNWLHIQAKLNKKSSEFWKFYFFKLEIFFYLTSIIAIIGAIVIIILQNIIGFHIPIFISFIIMMTIYVLKYTNFTYKYQVNLLKKYFEINNLDLQVCLQQCVEEVQKKELKLQEKNKNKKKRKYKVNITNKYTYIPLALVWTISLVFMFIIWLSNNNFEDKIASSKKTICISNLKTYYSRSKMDWGDKLQADIFIDKRQINLSVSPDSKLAKREMDIIINHTNNGMKEFWIDAKNGKEDITDYETDLNKFFKSLGNEKLCE